MVADRVVPVFGGGVRFACSRRVAVAPGVPGTGTGSDCAGVASFPGRGTRVAGQTGAGRAHSRCQQVRNPSFQGQAGRDVHARARPLGRRGDSVVGCSREQAPAFCG